ncbi:MAG: cation diffusion facilitator family transporter [Proteobacteria bacterium]|jgi:ferrous-iron efflux pump FieF|nr:cation diffusion facilitator family transporter [Alphaproteobacteria bacterium]NCC03582.1 cation diffusion facilitator family transporter [Pseudomonadota bacterium]
MKNIKKTIDDNWLRRFTSLTSISVALTLVATKLAAYLVTDSVSMLSSLVDSSVDLVASCITAYGVVIAMRPPDREHRYGHGKAEALAALMQGLFIVVSAFLLLAKAVERFINPFEIQNPKIGYEVMGVAIFLTAVLIALQTYTIHRTSSLAIASDRLHYVGDVFVNSAVMATFAFQEWLKVTWIDPAFAVVVAIILGAGSYKIIRRALRVLMDAELPDAERQKILSIVCGIKGVCGAHDLRTREGNGHPIISIHVEMDPSISLLKSHDVVEAVIAAVTQAYPKADVTVHQDPDGIKEARLDTQIENNSSSSS